MGGEDEAAHYFEKWGFDWLTTPGAIDWLKKIATEMGANPDGTAVCPLMMALPIDNWLGWSTGSRFTSGPL